MISAETITVAIVIVLFMAGLFAIDTWFARRRERREELPPLGRHRWQGDDEHQP